MTATAHAPRPVNLSRLDKVYPPARCDVSVVRPVIFPCSLLPAGGPGAVVLNGELYHLIAITEPSADDSFTLLGYRFLKASDPTEPRDVDCDGGRPHCDCPDSLTRQRAGSEGCKHARAVRILRQQGNAI